MKSFENVNLVLRNLGFELPAVKACNGDAFIRFKQSQNLRKCFHEEITDIWFFFLLIYIFSEIRICMFRRKGK